MYSESNKVVLLVVWCCFQVAFARSQQTIFMVLLLANQPICLLRSHYIFHIIVFYFLGFSAGGAARRVA